MTPPSRLSYTRPLHPSRDTVPEQGVLYSSFALQVRGYPRLTPPTLEAAPLFNKQLGVKAGSDAGWTTPWTRQLESITLPLGTRHHVSTCHAG